MGANGAHNYDAYINLTCFINRRKGNIMATKPAKKAPAAKSNQDQAAAKLAAKQKAKAEKQKAAELKAKKAEASAKAKSDLAAKKKAEADKKKAAAADKKEKAAAAKQAIADKKAAQAKAKAELAEKKKADREARKMPTQNGQRRPGPNSIGGRIYAICDKLTEKRGSPTPVAPVIEAGVKEGICETSLRCGYAQWRKFNGISGRIVDGEE
jgi:hypothetical protein